MKNFNLEDFKAGKIAVHCNTEEKAKNFLKVCDMNDIEWKNGTKITQDCHWETYKEETTYVCANGYSKLGRSNRISSEFRGEIIIKWEIALTFKEVVENIKEGEIWESCAYDNLKEISINEAGTLKFKFEDMNCDMLGVSINGSLYKLQRKEYNFQEAFKKYEEGKEIESKHSGYKYKKIDGKDNFMSKNYDEWDDCVAHFDLEEIRGAWYINE